MDCKERFPELFTDAEIEILEAEKDTFASDNIVLELTRRCQLSCAHCLRGNAQNCDMSKKTIIRTINMMSSISSITFTGGEPTLRVDLIEFTYEFLMEKFGKNGLPSFFIATNGLSNQLELASVLLKWYANCAEPEMCSVTISSDIFHDNQDRENYLSGLAFFNEEEKFHSLQEKPENCAWLLAEGRGKELIETLIADGYTGKAIDQNTKHLNVVDVDDPIEAEYIWDTIAVTSMLYISAKEEVSACCDCSYETLAVSRKCDLSELCDYVKMVAKREEIA